MSQAAYTLKNQSLFSRILDSLDVFGQLPNLRVLKKERLSSKVGFLLTLALITFILIYLANEFIQMIQQSQPQMVVSEELIFDSQPFPLKNDNFTLVISISDWQNEQIIGLNKYFTFEIKSCVRTRTETESYGNVTVNNTCISVPFETCNTSHFTTELQYDFFKKIRLGSHQCINRDYLQQTPPVLKGQFNGNEFHYLILYLRICKNTTKIQTCAPIEEITSKLSSAQYNIYSSDYLLQLARSGKPFEQIITPYYSTFSSSSSKQILQYFEIIDTVTDNGLLIQELDNSINLKQSSFEEFSQLYNNNFLIQHYVALKQIKTNYFRSYIKIQTILAKIGGIWQFLITIITVLLKPIFVDLMILKVSNKLFRFNCQKDSKDNQIISERLPDTYFQAIKTLFGCNKKEKLLFQKAKFELAKKLDIVKILQQLQMLDLIYSIVLNDQERCLIKLLSKPTVNTQEKLDEFPLDSRFNLDSQNLQSRSSFAITKKLSNSQKLPYQCHSQAYQQDMIKSSYLYLKQQIEKENCNKKQQTNILGSKLIELLEKNYQKFVSTWLSPKSFTHRLQMSEFDDILEPIPRLPL